MRCIHRKEDKTLRLASSEFNLRLQRLEIFHLPSLIFLSPSTLATDHITFSNKTVYFHPKDDLSPPIGKKMGGKVKPNSSSGELKRAQSHVYSRGKPHDFYGTYPQLSEYRAPAAYEIFHLFIWWYFYKYIFQHRIPTAPHNKTCQKRTASKRKMRPVIYGCQ